jgi:hypothetical protein
MRVRITINDQADQPDQQKLEKIHKTLQGRPIRELPETDLREFIILLSTQIGLSDPNGKISPFKSKP